MDAIDVLRLRVVSNFSNGDCGAGEIHTRTTRGQRRVYFARPTIAIARIRDYSQSNMYVGHLYIYTVFVTKGCPSLNTACHQ